MGTCAHLGTVDVNVTPSSEGCEDCLRNGGPLATLAFVHALRPRRLL